PQLHLAAEAAGSNGRAIAKVLELWSIRKESITRIFALRNRAEIDTIGKLKWHILETVHRKIDASIEKGFVNFFGEEPLAADLRQRHIQNFIPCRLDRHELDRQIRPALLQFALRPVRLP